MQFFKKINYLRILFIFQVTLYTVTGSVLTLHAAHDIWSYVRLFCQAFYYKSSQQVYCFPYLTLLSFFSYIILHYIASHYLHQPCSRPLRYSTYCITLCTSTLFMCITSKYLNECSSPQPELMITPHNKQKHVDQ